MGVLAPLALLTALLVKAPHVGMEQTHDPNILQIPRVSISWVASNDGPVAGQKIHSETYKAFIYIAMAQK
jgi:hypothetical protein